MNLTFKLAWVKVKIFIWPLTYKLTCHLRQLIKPYTWWQQILINLILVNPRFIKLRSLLEKEVSVLKSHFAKGGEVFFCLCQKTQIRSSKEKFPNCSSMFTAICESSACREINKKKYFAKTVPVEFHHQYNLPVKHLFQKEMDIFSPRTSMVVTKACE